MVVAFSKPLAGLTVVEVARGVSDLGLGMAGGVPGMIFADLGADVTRIVGTTAPSIDASMGGQRVWHRNKHLTVTDDAAAISTMLADADVGFVYGSERDVEERGLGAVEMTRLNPSLVYARCRPSRTARGAVADYALLVEAQAGLNSQLTGHRPGPIFIDAPTAAAGTAFILLSSALSMLVQRSQTHRGGWTETSLYDGMLASLGAMVGRSEHAPFEVERYWAQGSIAPNFMYMCADGEPLQVWFGGKGMYAALIEALGDAPSNEGYYADQMSGGLVARALRWKDTFATRPRKDWIDQLRAAGVACEPVLRSGEALADPHLSQIGLTVERFSAPHREVQVGCPISVTSMIDPSDVPQRPQAKRVGRVLLEGVRVLDFSAYLAGPLGAQVLADLGADVIKVEPPEGEAMRAASYAVAACQRGKRSLALDLRAPQARPIIDRLISWADVVVHNFRVGVSERLGIDEESVARLNPTAIYCHASAFGTTGPRAKLPGNDALMQAITGLERNVGGADNQPIAPTWIPIDVAGGWVASAGMLAALYARSISGHGQLAMTTLLGAGMLLQSDVFERDGQVVHALRLDREQTGYGPGYRIFEGSDGKWFALVVPDAAAWSKLRLATVDLLSPDYTPLRDGVNDNAASQAERILEATFATAPASEWVRRLTALGLLVEEAASYDRDLFRRHILDDPLNHQLGRVISFPTHDWGRFDQIGPLMRFGPFRHRGPRHHIPGIGEHTIEVLAELGCGRDEIDDLLCTGAAAQLPGV